MNHYVSELRAEQLAATRARIVAAAAEGVEPGDAARLTFAEVARRARVAERTVYRHFPTQAALQAALVEHYEQAAGTSFDRLTIEELADLPRRFFPAFKRFGGARLAEEPEPLRAYRAERYAAFRRAIEPLTRGMSPRQARGVAAVLQALCSVDMFRRMVGYWELDAHGAAEAASWAMKMIVDALREKERCVPHDPAGRRSTSSPRAAPVGAQVAGKARRGPEPPPNRSGGTPPAGLLAVSTGPQKQRREAGRIVERPSSEPAGQVGQTQKEGTWATGKNTSGPRKRRTSRR
jgi:AcrR family transcriptional regulator